MENAIFHPELCNFTREMVAIISLTGLAPMVKHTHDGMNFCESSLGTSVWQQQLGSATKEN
jgi:hypothetical protein